jgi:hypothetical protein
MAKYNKKYKTLSEENTVLVNSIDSFVRGILKEVGEAHDPPLPLLTKLDVLDKLAKWFAVRNKLVAAGDADNEGGQLDSFRNRLKASHAIGRKTPGILGDRPGDFVNTTYARRPVDERRDGDGADLASLRARLPRADDGDHGDDRDDDGGEDDPVFRDGGSVRADLSGDQSGDDNGADRDRDV